MYHGHVTQTYTPNKYGSFPSAPYRYETSYYTNKPGEVWTYDTLQTFDGTYVESGSSSTSLGLFFAGCGGYFVCYLDCDYFTVSLDSQAVPTITCTC